MGISWLRSSIKSFAIRANTGILLRFVMPYCMFIACHDSSFIDVITIKVNVYSNILLLHGDTILCFDDEDYLELLWFDLLKHTNSTIMKSASISTTIAQAVICIVVTYELEEILKIYWTKGMSEWNSFNSIMWQLHKITYISIFVLKKAVICSSQQSP